VYLKEKIEKKCRTSLGKMNQEDDGRTGISCLQVRTGKKEKDPTAVVAPEVAGVVMSEALVGVQNQVADQEEVVSSVVGLVPVLGLVLLRDGAEASDQGLAGLPEDGWLHLGDRWGLVLALGHSSRLL